MNVMVTLTLRHEDPFHLREFVADLTKESNSALQHTLGDSSATHNVLHAMKALLASARSCVEGMNMQCEGHRKSYLEASNRITVAAHQRHIRCWHIEERRPAHSHELPNRQSG